MTETGVERLAKIAYEAYADSTGWRSLATGDNLPAWKSLPGPIQAAWLGVAMAVEEALQ